MSIKILILTPLLRLCDNSNNHSLVPRSQALPGNADPEAPPRSQRAGTGAPPLQVPLVFPRSQALPGNADPEALPHPNPPTNTKFSQWEEADTK